MKVVGKIVQWFFVAFFLMFILVSGVHISSLFFLLGAILMMPIKPLRDLLKKIKIKSWLAILLSVVVVFTGIMLTPVDTGSPYDYIDDTDYTVSDFDYTEATTQETTVKQTEKPTEAPTKPQTEPLTEKPTEAVVGSGKAEKVNVSDIPEYSGTAYTVINNNIPNFSASELTTKGYEKYSSLDSKGRCGVAIASCGTEIMPADGEERGSISSIKPSGWIQAKYSGISGGYLWNRCHLIGWQLSAENANRSNLITGTRYMNIEGMLTFENMVADYIKETNNNVAYRVTPIFEDDNLVCNGVQIEAYSIEDDGEGICFNVYCYNIQPNITIDYATGSSSGPGKDDGSNHSSNNNSNNSSNNTSNNNSSNSQSDGSGMVWIPQSGSKYHSRSGCSNMKNPSQVTQSEAESMGYEPCKKCY